MLELLKKNIAEIIGIFIAVSFVYFMALKTNTPVKSIHFVIMCTVNSFMIIFTIKMIKRYVLNNKGSSNK